MKDLEFIRSVVKEWPEGAKTVRLDYDGEICFNGAEPSDFFPEDLESATAAFVSRGGWREASGLEYTRKQWAGE